MFLNYDCLLIIAEYLKLSDLISLSYCNSVLRIILYDKIQHLKDVDFETIYKEIYNEQFKTTIVDIGFYKRTNHTNIVKTTQYCYIRNQTNHIRIISYPSFDLEKLISRFNKHYKCILLQKTPFYKNYKTIAFTICPVTEPITQRVITMISVEPTTNKKYNDLDVKDYTYLKDIKDYDHYHDYTYYEYNSFFEKYISSYYNKYM